MPKRDDLKKIMIIGSGPIIIGQAAEFDYSGSQACKSLKEEGYQVVLVNSNPATIMTDLNMADRTYIEPLVPDILKKIIQKEKPDALLPTMGGQTGLNLAVDLYDNDILDHNNVELIGAKIEAIKKAEDRELFQKSMGKIGISVPKSYAVNSIDEAITSSNQIGYPVVIRPAFTLGGTGGGIAYNQREMRNFVNRGFQESKIHQVLIEENVIGWKEYELEVMRDLSDNVVIICSIENMDPMGIHTGDSITVAPAQTLSDIEYQQLRDASINIIREIGVETGGSNIQFAVNPDNGGIVSIEMNPRVSRSSALASKATGFPIAKIAAKLAIGYTLDEIPNDITRETFAAFEPTIDYVVVKVPRFNFDKFPMADAILTTQMKSVGEAMAIGRTFEETLQKALRSLEYGRFGLHNEKHIKYTHNEVITKLQKPSHDRIFFIHYALSNGFTVDKIAEITHIDPWFIEKIKNISLLEDELKRYTIKTIPKELLKEVKKRGFSDTQIAYLLNTTEKKVKNLRRNITLSPVYKMVDTCAAEFEAKTPYFYSCYDTENESKRNSKRKAIIIGSGPNRIGQGIEFDYCCVQGVFSLKEENYETIMVNCNPETVSTDYDTSDKLYFEPITYEDVLNIIENEIPDGIILQLGGQTPLNLSKQLQKENVRIFGTSSDAIDLAEDRRRFAELLSKLHIPQPDNGIALNPKEAEKIAERLGFPILIRPSYVLGGRGMEIVYTKKELKKFVAEASNISPKKPILVDKFLEDAVEVEVDALSDGKDVLIGAIMEHIEEAGIHSGDSACILPPISLNRKTLEQVKEYTRLIAISLGVIGLINIQFAVRNDVVYVLEANPRSSRTIPFVSKATGIPLAKIAVKLMIGKSLREIGVTERLELDHVAVKEAVFPFNKLKNVDPILGPEMKSTGEVMGIDHDFGLAYYKAELAAGNILPEEGGILISVKDKDKIKIVEIVKEFKMLGFNIFTTKGTSDYLLKKGIRTKTILKIREGRPNICDAMINGTINLVINTPASKGSNTDDYYIRRTAVDYKIPYITTLAGAIAAVKGLKTIKKRKMTVKSIQEYHHI